MCRHRAIRCGPYLVVTRIDVLRYRYMVVDSDSSLVLL